MTYDNQKAIRRALRLARGGYAGGGAGMGGVATQGGPDGAAGATPKGFSPGNGEAPPPQVMGSPDAAGAPPKGFTPGGGEGGPPPPYMQSQGFGPGVNNYQPPPQPAPLPTGPSADFYQNLLSGMQFAQPTYRAYRPGDFAPHQLRQTYTFNPATDPSRIVNAELARLKAEKEAGQNQTQTPAASDYNYIDYGGGGDSGAGEGGPGANANGGRIVNRRPFALGGQPTANDYEDQYGSYGTLPVDFDGGNFGAPDPGAPTGAPGTGNFGTDLAGFGEAVGPALGGAAVGAALGGPAGAAVGMVGATMAQGLAEATGLSAPATSPPGGLASVAGNIAQTQMGMTPTSNPAEAVAAAVTGPQSPADQEDADQGAAAAAAAAAAQAAAEADNTNSMSEASTADAAGPGDDAGGPGGDGDFARGGVVGNRMDPRSLPGIHVKTDHRFAAGGATPDDDEEEGFDAYHGSPHEFERFDSSKISTGQGVQAYGHGHYLAEDENVAREYRNSLEKPASIKIKNEHLIDLHDRLMAANEMDKAKAIELLHETGDTLGVNSKKHLFTPKTLEWFNNEIAPHVSRDGGKLYHVRVKAKPEHFLDWDAPLSKQHPQVVQALDQVFPDAMDYWRRVKGSSYDNGGHFHDVAAENFAGSIKEAHNQIAAKLHAAGIPGIKYFDRDSRSAGKGTRNYVIFDPDMIKVKRRYADGGQITPPRDLDADPAVQQALDITRQAQPTAPQMARQLNEQGMYSHAAEVAAGLPQAKGSPQQMMAMLSSRGVKPDEIKHSGVEDAFGNQKVVTKDQLAQHFNENMPQIEKVVLGGKQPFDEQRLAQLEKEYSTLDEHPIDAPSFGEDKYNEMIRLMNIRDQSSTQSLYDAAERAMQQAQRAQSRGDRNTAERYFREHELLNTRAEKLDLEGQGLSRPTKYKSFTLPGGENYREVLFKAKERNADQLEAAQNKRYELRLLYDDAMENYKKISESNPGHPNAVAAYQKVNETRSALKNAEKELSDLQSEAANRTYESSHWDEPNVLAHVRLLDRKAPSGEKVLHVEEIQSDWAQEGRREGFKDVDALKKFQKKNLELMAQFQEAHKAHKDLTDRLAPPVNERFRPGEESPREYENRIDALEAERQNSLAEHPEWKASAKRLQDIRNAHKALGEQMPPDTGVPAGPYVTNTQAWTDLALKAALKEAVEGNYDRIAWTGGQDQAERYDLSKHIDSVHYNPGTQTLYAMNKNGREVLNEDAEPHEIQKHIGKELADKLLADVPDLHSVINEHEIEKDPETGKWGIFLYGDPIHDYGGDPLEFDSKSDAKDHLREMVQESLNNHTSTLRNVDLVVGGEGMKSYYDKIVPTRIMEVTKKLGVPTKVEPHKIDTEEGEKTLHSIKVTPELKAAVMRGMPVYKAGGAVSYSNGGMAFDNPIIQEALRIAAKKRPMVALADLFQRQLRGRPPS